MIRVTMFFLAVGLAMDAFAVSISCGLANEKGILKGGLRVAGAFGFFQAMMAFLGWALGEAFEVYINSCCHWIALILLCFIGVNMIIESRVECRDNKKKLNFKTLMMLSIATSIDALAAGISLKAFEINIAEVVFEIGIVTFILSFIGVAMGKKLCSINKFKSHIEILGGVILIIIGFKVFISHFIA